MSQRFRIAGVMLAAALAASPAGASESESVDLELVLAIDVSGSIDPEEAALQRRGYIGALQDGRVLSAIKTGFHGKIGVTYFEWAGVHHRRTVADWAVIGDPASAKAFTDWIDSQSISTGAWTSISGAIEFALQRFAESPFKSRRRVLDISGDGPNNNGPYVVEWRDRALAQGITINGLPIINDRPSRWGLPPFLDLDLYFEDCVIGGRGAFIVVADSFDHFAAAIRRKLTLEIADVHPSRGARANPVTPIGVHSRDAHQIMRPDRDAGRLIPAAEHVRPRGRTGPRPPCDSGEQERFQRRLDR
jgi:hypothetical protein